MAKKQRLIEPVKNHEEKRITYKTHMERYNRAVEEEFYFEAILIDYACLEDRLRYMLYHMGLIFSERDHKIAQRKSDRVKTFENIFLAYRSDPKCRFGISTAQSKRELVYAVSKFILANQDSADKGNMNSTEKVLLEALDDENQCLKIIDLMGRIEKWCDYRNEIIHALMNKRMESLEADVANKAVQGYDLFRELDKYVSWVKRKNIRSKLGLKTSEKE